MKHYKTEEDFLKEYLNVVFTKEDQLQECCWYWTWNFRQQTRRCIWHVPNGGARTKVQAVQFSAMGVVAGCADIHFYWQSQLYLIELKVGSNTLSDAQIKYRDAMTRQGAIFYECRTFERWCEIIDSILFQQKPREREFINIQSLP